MLTDDDVGLSSLVQTGSLGQFPVFRTALVNVCCREKQGSLLKQVTFMTLMPKLS